MQGTPTPTTTPMITSKANTKAPSYTEVYKTQFTKLNEKKQSINIDMSGIKMTMHYFVITF